VKPRSIRARRSRASSSLESRQRRESQKCLLTVVSGAWGGSWGCKKWVIPSTARDPAPTRRSRLIRKLPSAITDFLPAQPDLPFSRQTSLC
jgi:hypothetical protein